MSTENRNRNMTLAPIESPLSMRELAVLLIKHYGIHEGIYDLLVEFQIGMGAVGPDPASLTPGAMIGVSKVGLVLAKETGQSSVNAALVNPAPSSVVEKTKSAIKKPVAKKSVAKKTPPKK